MAGAFVPFPIRLRGVRQNNLKGIDLDLPVRRLIVVTGISGSGKSSLAFETLFAEGQRRYIETFSPYARQFFDRMDKPRVDSIEGVPPAIAVEQRNAVRTTRSTVGTMTEICDYVRLFWPRLAQLHCRGCGRPVRQESPQEIWRAVRSAAEATPGEWLVAFDLPLTPRMPLADSLDLLARQGYHRLLVGAGIVRVEEAATHPAFDPTPLRLTVIQDRLRISPENRGRFAEACEQAYHFGQGRLQLWPILPDGASASRVSLGPGQRYSRHLHCPDCDFEYRMPTPALFSFNHPLGACPACRGFGRVIRIDSNLAIPDPAKSLAGGAVRPWQSGMSAECQADLIKFCRARGIPTDTPFCELSAEHRRWVLEGDPDYGTDDEHQWPYAWYGVKGYFRWLESKAYKMHVRVLLSRYRAYAPCPECQGRRLQPEALLYRIRSGNPSALSAPLAGTRDRLPAGGAGGLTLAEFYALPLRDALAWIDDLSRGLERGASDAVGIPVHEVRSRLAYLVDVGLGYLTLDRPTRTLSGGETERVNLTTCLGTRLVNTLFVLDEPSVGLHPRDTARLVRLLQRLRDAGNTVVVVEHEAAIIRAADHIVDLGPGHGESGGELIYQGSYPGLLGCSRSLTGQYLSGRRSLPVVQRRPVRLERAAAAPGEGDGWRMHEALPPAGLVSQQGQIGAPTPGSDPAGRVRSGDEWVVPCLRLAGATRHNLVDLTVSFPLRRLVCVSGVSGSGKTTLIREVLVPALERCLQTVPEPTAAPRTAAEGSREAEDEQPETNGQAGIEGVVLSGAECLDRVVHVDQSPVGRTPRSNPAVYTGAFDEIRELFARSPDARRQGLGASAFSFNSPQGQCERCRGAGFEKIEMQFLSDVFIRCPECDGRRYRPHILAVKVTPSRAFEPGEVGAGRKAAAQSSSVADLLDSTVDEAVAFLDACADSPAANRAASRLRLLQEVGLGYLRLGQPVNTLSGGESQRLKLVGHLAGVAASAGVNGLLGNRPDRGILFLFDEPTTGLHFEDVRTLLQVFQRLVDAGHSVFVIEHNLDVIRAADWVVDLGPDAGAEGGRVVVAGTPEEVAACAFSHTGEALRGQANTAQLGPRGAPRPIRRRPGGATRCVRLSPGRRAKARGNSA